MPRLARVALFVIPLLFSAACFGDEQTKPPGTETPPSDDAMPLTITPIDPPAERHLPHLFDVQTGTLQPGSAGYESARRAITSWRIEPLERLTQSPGDTRVGVYSPATDSWEALDFAAQTAYEAISADGSRAAMAVGDGRIVLIDLKAKTYRQLPVFGFAPAFSPGGSRVLLALWDADTPENMSRYVVIDFADPASAPRLPLGQAGNRNEQGRPVWLNDTSLLVLSGAVLQLVDVSGPALRLAAEHLLPSERVALSPGLTTIAVRSTEELPDTGAQIYGVDPFRLIADLPGLQSQDLRMLPSDDGSRLLIALDRCLPTERLINVDVATGTQTEIARGGIMEFAFSPDGRWVAYTAFGRDGFVVSADGSSSPRLVSDDVAAPSTPSWSEDSRFVSFSSHGGGYDRCLS